ncbi:MAG: hypothetical protein IPK82_34310 [Polyangiaceae bacterium]|nr:hypothetical protein [Polyangiaceae bacterium]
MREYNAVAKWSVLALVIAGSGCSGKISIESTAGAAGTSSQSSAGGDSGTGGATSTATATTTSFGTGGSTGGAPGCLDNEDCVGNPNGSLCNPETGACVTCLVDGDCGPGLVCEGKECVSGCNVQQPCMAGWTCCFGACLDLATNNDNCGSCGNVCPPGPMGVPQCSLGACTIDCPATHADCNGIAADGCEHNTVADGPCVCAPGSLDACYWGAPGTMGVGACKAGERVCNPDGLSFGPCEGDILPAAEICTNGIDDNCNGAIDENVDVDGDGFGTCDGDCDDNQKKVNPGAIENTEALVDHDLDPATPPIIVYTGNGIDDDCDPSTPDFGPPPFAALPKSSPACCPSISRARSIFAKSPTQMRLCQ